MGLDMNPLAKPKPGHEAEFVDLWTRIQVAQGKRPDPEAETKGFLARLFTPRKPANVADMIARFQAISVPPYAAIGAPVVGKDQAADDWLRETFDNGTISGVSSFAEAQKAFHGYHAVEALPVCDGFPVYTHAGMYEGVDRTSFRGKFLEICEEVIGDDLLAQAWNPMLAAELAAWGRALKDRAAAYAAQHNVTHVLDNRDFMPADDTSPEAQAHIVDQAARWALWWSDRGHGSDPYF